MWWLYIAHSKYFTNTSNVTSVSTFSSLLLVLSNEESYISSMAIRVCPRHFDCNPSSEWRVCIKNFSWTLCRSFHHTPSCCSLHRRCGRSPLQPIWLACRAGEPPQAHHFRRTHARVPDPSALVKLIIAGWRKTHHYQPNSILKTIWLSITSQWRNTTMIHDEMLPVKHLRCKAGYHEAAFQNP